MKKLINDPARFARETMEGIVMAHPDRLRPVGDWQALVSTDAPAEGRVAVVTGGGSGHLPLFLGYVGRGLCDGVAVGGVFNSPSAETMLEVTRLVHGGRGVLYLYGNYGGDVMNFDLAAELAAVDGIDTATVLATDDVASAPQGRESRRRGIAGIVLLYKVAGAAAARGDSLDEVVAVTARAATNLRSMGVALSPCTVPLVGRPTFEISEDEMEVGMGIHGEPGVRRGRLSSADEVATELYRAIAAELGLVAGDRVAVLVNGLGATPPEELYLLYRRVHTLLATDGVEPAHVRVGEYATSLEMAGASVSVLRLDDELLELLDAPVSTPFVSWGEPA